MSVVVDSLRGVKQVIKVRLLPTEAEAAALDTTLRTCNAAATWLSQQMHATRVFRKFDAQRRFYVELRERFNLGAQPTIRVLGKVADAYTSLRANVAAGDLGRLLRKRCPKEARFAADINHQISKRIVAEAERTGQGIAVERLTGIRERVRLRKPQRATLHSWAFAQLGSFLAYKARQAGVAFVEVDPAYTSQTCSACGWVDKRNRRSQAAFTCVRCRFVGHADHNAAIIIAARGVDRWGEVMRPYAAPTLTASEGGSSTCQTLVR